MPYDNVRLLVPWDVEYETKDGTIVKERQDVIVDAIELEKHTTGRNPFTGEVNQPIIPEEHQVDPTTEEVIWHRYIAGTRQPIEWPWEESRQKEMDEKRRKRNEQGDEAVEEDAGKSATEGSQGAGGFLRTANPMNWLRKNKSSDQDAQVSKESEGNHLAPDYDVENQHRARPREFEPPAYDDDTGRNIIEIDENHPDHFVPTLVYPPMPETVAEELRDTHISHINRKRVENQLSPEELKAERAARKAEKEAAKQRRLDSMKTPMQIRWDLEQAKKAKYDPNNPTPPPADLLLALGRHMEANQQTASK
jgi:large subunit ribosomal protein L24